MKARRMTTMPVKAPKLIAIPSPTSSRTFSSSSRTINQGHSASTMSKIPPYTIPSQFKDGSFSNEKGST